MRAFDPMAPTMHGPPPIVHIITGLDQGGAESMLHKLVRAARQASPGLRQTVVSLTTSGCVGPRIQADGIDVVSLNMRQHPLRALMRLHRLLRELPRETVVQTWMYHADLIGGLVARLAGRQRVFWNVRQATVARRDVGPRTYWVIRLAARLSGLLPRRIVTNAAAAVAVHEAAGYSAARFVVIGNGFDTQAFGPDMGRRQAFRAQHGIGDDEFLVGNVARFDVQKDLATFVRMAGRVAEQMPNARFLIAGSGVPEAESLTREIAQAGLSGRFILLDRQADVPALMNGLDVFCLSSRSEGFPNVLGEAMASAIPCVTTACGDAGAVLGEPEFVSPIEDPDRLAASVLKIGAMASTQRHDMGAALRRRIQTSFSTEAVWKTYLELYESQG
jgi:glycosyltransferase involved in cell wall biosynthesis